MNIMLTFTKRCACCTSLRSMVCLKFACSLKIFAVKYSFLIIEPPHDKTNKMTVRPAKTQVSQSESSLCAQ